MEQSTKIPSDKTWWRPFKNEIAKIQLKGLEALCPKCNDLGYAVTRWTKGPVVKPICILHGVNVNEERICTLDEEQSAIIRDKVFIDGNDINNMIRATESFVLFSGGKDSLATLIYLKEIAESLNKSITALFIDTTAGLPESKTYVEDVCNYLKVNLQIVKPEQDYFTLVKEWGIPSFNKRWCCRELKIKPVANFLSTIKGPKVVFDGIRAQESRIRKQYIPIWYHPGFKCLSVSPIFYWKKEEVFSFINKNGVPKTLLHQMSSSTECWCGAYKTESDFRKLFEINEDMFHKLSGVEEQNINGYTYLYKNGQKIPLKELEAKILKGNT
ncbi:MAG: phosphoadenosine phosphosulfate reductase family protein [bacterium]|nr:phosphoadenosine phosphosulfate reductase family protein [bacterium]